MLKIKHAKKAKSFVIDRKKWLRQTPGACELESYLFAEGKMCCLGFYGKACGIKPKQMAYLYNPSEISDYPKEKVIGFPVFMVTLQKWHPGDILRDEIYVTDTVFTKRLMEINDNENTTDAHKEKYIIKEFAKQGVKVKFIN